MKFNYKARTPTGELQSGIVEASSQEAAVTTLQSYDLVVVGIEPVATGVSLKREIKFFSRVKKEEIVIFSRQLSVLFDAQVPLLESLKTLAAQTESKTFKKVITDIAEEVDAGTSFSQALERYPKLFSNFYISVVKAGEASGRLQEVLNYLADHEEKNYDLNKKVRGAMIYPAFIVFSLVAVAFVMMIFVVPQLTEIFEETGAELPFLTRVIINVSTFMESFWWLVLIGGIGLGIFGWLYWRTPQGRALWDLFLIKIPVFKNIFQKIYLTRFSENLSTLVKGGIPIIQALTITGSVVGNTVYKEVIEEAREAVRRGGGISTVLQTNKNIPKLVSQMVRVGEETGSLEIILAKVASFYQKDVDNMVNNLTALIQPVLILILGTAAGLLVAAILLPIYNLSSSF